MAAVQEGGGADGTAAMPAAASGMAGVVRSVSGASVVGACVWGGAVPWLAVIIAGIVLALIIAAARKDPEMFERMAVLIALVLGRTVARQLTVLRGLSRGEKPRQLRAVALPDDQLSGLPRPDVRDEAA